MLKEIYDVMSHQANTREFMAVDNINVDETDKKVVDLIKLKKNLYLGAHEKS